ncbi:MAG: SDR family oxidoreductase [Porticoccaceae bacterium]
METESKVVIITGASSGMGEATARRLAAKGARLVIAARRGERLAALAEELASNVVWVQADVSQRRDMEALADTAVRHFGRIDVLVNNAGYAAVSLLEAGLVDEWEKMIDVNFKGPLYGIHAVLPVMLRQGAGQIINVSSVSGSIVMPGTSVYSASKAALNTLSEGLRRETAGKIRVSVISPGGTDTEMPKYGSVPRLSADSVARAIEYLIFEPGDVAINELTIRSLFAEL